MPIYKYVASKRLDVLERQELRFTQPAALNDPFEFRPLFDAVLPAEIVEAQLRRPVDIGPILAEAHARMPADVRAQHPLAEVIELVRAQMGTPEGVAAAAEAVNIFHAGIASLGPAARTMLERLAETVGILSLTSDPTSVTMWAHYAENHTGMVLVFTENHEFFDRRRSPQDEFYHLRPVVYEIPMPPRTLSELDGVDFFLRKHPAWSYEKEIRMIAPLAAASRVVGKPPDAVHLFAFPADCLVGIVLGLRSTPSFEERIRKTLDSAPKWSHVALQRTVADDRNQCLKIEALAR